MKKLAKISALLFAVVLIATGCKKLPEFTDGSSSGNVTPTTGGTLYYRLNDEPEIGANYISISAKYGSENEITGMWLLVSEKADMPAGYTQYADIQMNYPEFSVTLIGLEPGTRYFWCINYIENDNSYVTDPEEFMTLEGGGGEAPTVITLEATTITANSAVLNGIISNYDNSLTYNCLFEWGDSESLGNVIVSENLNNGSFSVTLTRLIDNETYYFRARATNKNGTACGDVVVFKTLILEDNHQYVDLGLPSGTLWATCDVGANNPEDIGHFFAWGETSTKDIYNWETYKYCNGSQTTMTKYCTNSSYGYNGFTDTLTIIQPEDDAARVYWGANWRMPTKTEWEELYQNTTQQWTYQNGVFGRLYTSSNGSSIFLRASGWYDDIYHDYTYDVYRWSSSLNYDSYNAWSIGYYTVDTALSTDWRYRGFPIRPVRIL